MSESEQIKIPLEPNSFYATALFITPSQEEFRLQIVAGHAAREYVISPAHAKRVMLLLQNQIADYESKFGELKTELPTMPNQTQPKKIGFAVDEDKKGN